MLERGGRQAEALKEIVLVVADQLQSQLGLVITPQLDPRTLLVVILATIGLSALAGLAPAIRGYRTPVSRSLRPIA